MGKGIATYVNLDREYSSVKVAVKKYCIMIPVMSPQDKQYRCLLPTTTMIYMAISIFILSACGPTTRPEDLLTSQATSQMKTSQPAATPTPRGTPLPGVGPEDFPSGVNPLTGLEVQKVSNLERQPVGVKINNYPRDDRPQWGLSLADIVFEYYHNNDLPRFHAIFYGQDAELAGPIRSARPFDAYLVQSYGLNFVFGSADDRVLQHLITKKNEPHLIYYLDGQCPPYPVCRHQPEEDNSLVTDTSIIDDFLHDQGVKTEMANLEGMWFFDQAPDGGEPLEKLFITYSYAAYLFWEYYPKTGKFIRFQDAVEAVGSQKELYQPLLDRINKQQIAADNVVVLLVPHIHRLYQPPAEGNAAVEIVDMKFSGSGAAYAMRDGQVYEVRWERPEYDGILTLTFPDGQPYPFKPGNTWYQVVTPETEIRTQPQEWYFDFMLVPKLKEWEE